jgi:ribokinase
MASDARVVVVGSYVQDHAWVVDRFPEPGETRRALGFSSGPGGKGFNQAIACRRQGVDTVFLGAIGDDALGATARRFATDEGLDARWQVVSPTPTAASSILVNAQGENQIAVDLAANERLDGAFLREHSAVFAGAAVVLCQLENSLAAIDAALALGRAAGARCVLNPAPVHPQLTRATIDAAGILTPNETEFDLLCERFTGNAPGSAHVATLADASLHALCRRLSAGTVVITLGRHGGFVSHGDDRRGDALECYRFAAESVQAMDTTGAGDAFSGGLAAGLCLFSNSNAADAAFARAVRHGNQVAALSTEVLGTAPAMPTIAQVAARFGD